MRFDRLQIPAFGPFTNLDLTFAAQRGDLHVIYGANEAGKSSLLRAFRDLLFGIHGQSPDNFVHDYKKLRIKGEIVNRKGERFTFQRRKGNKNTLLDADGNELPDNAIDLFLGSVDQEYFSTMFGLGARELREGAEQLLRGEGDIGNALFSASMGGTPVQLVLQSLMEESDRLFKGRATANVSIRPTIAKYKELLHKSKESLVSPEAWEKIAREHAEAEKNKKNLEEEISSLTRDLEWLTRCEDALPTVGRLNEETRKKETLPSMPIVSSDFVERARAVRKDASDALTEVNRLTAQITIFKEQLVVCQSSPAVIEEADTLDRLHQDLGVYRDRKNSLADLETELAGFEAILRTGMKNLDLIGDFSIFETMRLNSAARLACEEAAHDLQKTLDEYKKNIEKTEDLKTQIKTLESQLKDLPESDLTQLRDALSLAAGAIEADRTRSISESEVNRLNHETKALHQELIGAPESLDMTGSLSIPNNTTIRCAGEEISRIKREIENEASKAVEGEKLIEAIQSEISQMERHGELPSVQALRKAREHRDHGWKIVLEEWKGNGSTEEFIPGTPLEEAFPQTVTIADDIADKLREQADLVAQVEEKRLQITRYEKQNGNSAKKLSELQNTLKNSQSSWEDVWRPCRITPRTPSEMEEWRDTWRKFKDLLRQLRDAEDALHHKNSQIQNAKIQLSAVLSESVDKDFLLLFEKAKRQVQEGEQALGRRIEVINQLQAMKNSLDALELNNARFTNAVDDGTMRWNEQCQITGLPKNIPPKSGFVLLQERKDLLTIFDSWKEVSTRCQKIKDDLSQYEKAIIEKAATLSAIGDTVIAQENSLWKMLTMARDAQTRHDQLSGQIKDAEITLDESQLSYNQALLALKELTHLAKLETVDELEPFLANLELRNHAEAQITTLRDTLVGLARSQSVDEFLSRIRAEDIDTLITRKGLLKSQKEEKEESLKLVCDAITELKGHKQKLESAGDTASDYRQQAESYAARLKIDASRFVRLRLAAHFLQTQIEQFRKENQGPLLEKSGRVFHCITRGAFAGLGAEFNADDTPILVGLRPDKTSVPIVGMSDGARDQLYLALRLAALDRYLEQHEPMPLILDDLLITFDDDRATAILPQLSELSQRTQIFLFTHHDHLVDICRQTLGEDAYHLHRLGGPNTGEIGN